MASRPLAPVQLPPGQFLARRVIDFCLPFESLLCALKLRAKCPLPSEKQKKENSRISGPCVRRLGELETLGTRWPELASGDCPPSSLRSVSQSSLVGHQ